MMGRHGVRPLGGLDEPLLPTISTEERYSRLQNKVDDWLSEVNPHLRRLKLAQGTFLIGLLLAVLLSIGVESENSYTISKSREDVVTVCVISSCLALFGTILTDKLSIISYWSIFVATILYFAKAIAFDWKDETTSVVLICALCVSAVQIQIASRIHSLNLERKEAQLFLDSNGEKGTAPASIVAEDPVLGTANKKAELSTLQLFGVMKPYFWPKGMVNKFRCFATYFFLLTTKVCNLFAPLFIGRAVQKLADERPIDEVYPLIVTFASLLFCARFCAELQNVTYLGVKQNAFAEIAERSYAHLHSLSMEWHLKKKLGQTLRSLDRGISAADTVVSYLFLYLVPSCFELVATALVFYHHFNIPSLSALIFVSFVAYVVATINLTLWRKKFRESTNKHDNDFHEKATDALQNFETVKYFSAERFETERYVDAVRNYQTFNVAMQVSLSVLNSTQQFILQTCVGSALCISAYHVSRGDLELGSFVSVQVYVASLFAPLSFLGTIYNAIVQAFVDMSNLSQLLAEHIDVQDAANAVDLIPRIHPHLAPTVQFKNVSFHYPSQNDTQGLKNISFFVESGTETAVVGKTGSGKTSLFRLLFRFYDPLGGEILISGQNIKYVTLASLRRAIGIVPQDTVLFNETILFNIKYGKRDATMEEVEEACRQAQILDRILSFPSGFNTVVGASGAKLSGGERQRVAIARCLLKDAPILVLDEFSSSLDGSTEQSVHQAINTLSQSRTVLVIAHRLSTVRKSNQIIVLEDGIILERGNHDELLEKKGKYFELWNKQLITGEESIDSNSTHYLV